eukprot:scaffold37711_cov112-Skeletonema_marinoi.AAC.9
MHDPSRRADDDAPPKNTQGKPEPSSTPLPLDDLRVPRHLPLRIIFISRERRAFAIGRQQSETLITNIFDTLRSTA